MIGRCRTGQESQRERVRCVILFRTGCMFELLGAILGALLGLVGPFLFAQIYVARGGDPTAAGALFIVTFLTVPAGLVIGAILGLFVRLYRKRRAQ
jgi:hypothetical protein